MKKLITLAAGLLSVSAIYALPVYNPSQPELLKYGLFTCGDDCWGVEIGYRGDYVFDRKLKLERKNNVADATTHRINDFELYTNAGQITLNLWDRVDAYGWVGASVSRFDATLNYLNQSGTILTGAPFNLSGRTEQDLSYGFGARAILWKCGRTAVGVDGQYAHYQSHFNNISVDGVPVEIKFDDVAGNPVSPNRFKLKHQEYQVSLGISHRICMFVPYIAAKYSAVRERYTGPLVALPSSTIPLIFADSNIKLKSKHNFGFAAGVTFVDADRMQVTAEGRWLDERALTIAADFRF